MRAVLWSDIVVPVCLAVIFVIAYMFMKSFPDANGNYPPSPLIRISLGCGHRSRSVHHSSCDTYKIQLPGVGLSPQGLGDSYVPS